MKSIKRASRFGTIICILTIIILFVFAGVSSCSDTQNNETATQTPVETQTSVETEVIPTETMTETAPTYVYNISSNDREMLARLVFLEGNMESLDCQKAIVSVVINRWQSGYWGSYLSDVVYAPYQFTPASRIPYVTPTATNYEAVDHVLKYGVTVPQYVLYFRANYHHNWRGYCGYVKIDNTCFGYMTKDKK